MIDFDEREFISKVDNIFVMYLTSIMMKKPLNVKHKVNDDVFNLIVSKVKYLNDHNYTQMYGEPNIKSTKIISKEQIDGKMLVKVDIEARYMDYIIDSTTKQFVSGNNSSRSEIMYHLEFEKSLDSSSEGQIKVCPGCGASIDVNRNGQCEYCHSIYNTEDYDWVMTKINN